MPRTSPVHYIAPSAISITPNCNSSANDLAVYLARDTKIRVYSKEAGIDYVNADFQQWTLKGRNRRLADSAKPYTIYARLHKTDHTDGYLVFAPKNLIDGTWYDKYAYVTLSGIVTPEGATVSDTYYYIRIGDVSLPDNGQRTLTYDTGILGTDQYNTDWIIDPDLLKRIMLQCSIDGRDAGSTPYVPWEKDLVLTAQMASGWFDPEILTFDHWTLVRDTGDTEADAAWQQKQAVQDFAQSGTITLSHPREGDDDFNGTVSSVFKVTAYGRTADGTVKAIAATSISIMAETVETYTIALSTVIVSYNPQTKTYNPDGGVMVRVRAKDQRGNLIRITNAQFEVFGLKLQYKRASAQAFTDLPLDSGAPDEVAVATIPITVFATQEGVDLRLVNTELKELDISNIAFVRDGEDSKDREWIFLRSSEAITFGDITSPHPLPSLIPGGEVSPHGTAGGDDHNKQQDDWVPQGWTDDSMGTDEDTPYEYGSYRDYIHGEDDEDGRWGDFVAPRVWSHFGEDAITYDIIPGVSVITADSTGLITMDGIAVKAYRIKGLDRSDNILPEGNPPSSGDYYYAEYSVDGGGYVPCVGLTQMDGYGIDADALATARESVAFRLKHSSAPDMVLKDSLPINVVHSMSEDWVKNNFLSKVVDDVAQGVITYVKGFWVKAKNLFGIDENGDAWLHHANMTGSVHIANDLNVDNEIHGVVAVLDKIVSSEYTGDGMMDRGFLLQYADGKAKLVIDDLVARGKFTVNELESRIWTYTGGNMVFSGAGSTIFFVEYLDASDNVLGYTNINAPWLLAGRPLLSAMVAWSKRRKVMRQLTDDEKARVAKFRCYEYSDDGTMQTRNWWHTDDLAFCQTLNHVKDKVSSDGSYSGSLSNTVYHRLVKKIGSGQIEALDDGRFYDYVELSNIIGEYDPTYNDWPAAGDTIVQRGNRTDSSRRSMVTIEVTGDTRGLKVYDKIMGWYADTSHGEYPSGVRYTYIGYDENTGRAKLEVLGDAYIGSADKTTTYVKYDEAQGVLEIKAKINAQSTMPYNGSDTTLANIFSGLNQQIDGKIETWQQDSDPASVWTTDDLKAKHVGDLWMDTSANGGKKTYIYKDHGASANPRYSWVQQDVPQAVFDGIDGKASVYATWGAWVIDNVNKLHLRDLLIPTADITEGGVTYKAGKVYRCTQVTPSIVFTEVAYTDDTTFHNYVGLLLNKTWASGDDATAAAAQRAVLRAVTGDTVVDGGLLLTSLIAMRQFNGQPGQEDDPQYYTTWGGISGIYDDWSGSTHAKGHGIAAWFGGAMVDKEDVQTLPASYAKSLFRMDGSGYVADGGLSWDYNGQGKTVVTLNGDVVKAANYYLNGNDITAQLSALFDMFTLEGDGTQGSPYIIKANYSLYSEGGIAALGRGSGGGGGGGASALYQLNDVKPDSTTTPTKVYGAQPGYVLTYGDDNHWYAAPTSPAYTLPLAADGTRGGVQVGYTTDAANRNYAVQLSGEKMFVNVPWTDHYAWTDITNKPLQIFHQRGDVSDNYVNGTTYETLNSGTYRHPITGASESIIHFQHEGSASGLDILFQYSQDANNPLKYRKNIDDNRFASVNWVTIIDSLNIGLQRVDYANSAGGVAWSNVSGKPSSYTPSSHNHAWGDITSGVPAYATRWPSWSEVTNKPSFDYLPLTGGTVTGNLTLSTGTLVLNNTNDVQEGAWNSPALCIGGTSTDAHIEIDKNEIVAKSNASTVGPLWVGGAGGVVVIKGYLNINTNSSTAVERIYVDGNIAATGGITCLATSNTSDIRSKDIKSYEIPLTVEQIAKAPTILFTWKKKPKLGMQVGSTAQYWKEVLPQSVTIGKDEEQTLGLQYGNTALVAVTKVAQKVVDHEERIRQLEKKCADLEKENVWLRSKIA